MQSLTDETEWLNMYIIGVSIDINAILEGEKYFPAKVGGNSHLSSLNIYIYDKTP